MAGVGSPVTVLYAAWAPFFSGAERALLILVEHLDPARYRPIVALGTRGELEHELRTRGIQTVHVPVRYPSVRGLPAWLVDQARLSRLVRRERVGLVHANDVPSFQPAGYVARRHGIPALTHVRFPDSAGGFAWFLKPGFREALFVSEALRQDALAVAPQVFEGRSLAVHDGVRDVPVVDEGGRQALRRELGLPLDAVVVGLTGQIAEIKGVWEFLGAAEALVARGVPVQFAILGDDLKGKGALRREAERHVQAKGLAARVTFLGFLPDAPRLIPAFDIIAVPSHVEPLGNATLEAMAAGVPVVGSRVGGIPEMVVDGETGLLVPPRDAAPLADALEALVRDADRRRAYGAAARRRMHEHFSVAAHVATVQAVYDRVCRNP